MGDMDNTKRAALREGDSWRAKTYRRKDKLFVFSQDALTEFLKTQDGEIAGLIVSTSKNLQELNDNPDNEEVAVATIKIFDEIDEKLKAAGFKPEPA